MHELSIVASVVDAVTEKVSGYPGAKVRSVRLRVGALQSVIRDSLEFCYGIATQDTLLAGSRLEVEQVPVAIWCADCALESELDGVQSFRCPRCGEQSMDIRRGRELDIDSVEIDTPEGEETGK
jgi:hydrogenase nickel incorporation protein HypA/HybF